MSFIVDSHVHIYPEFDVSLALRSGISNLKALSPSSVPILCITRTPREDTISKLRDGRLGVPGFQVVEAYPASLKIESQAGEILYVVCGRQYATAEKIEVLGIGLDNDDDQKLSLGERVAEIQATGALAVIPWSLGKWWGSRGRFLKTFLKTDLAELTLGDIPLRVSGAPVGAGVKSALPVLRGSDPLPFSGEERRIGSFANLFEGEFDPKSPVSSIVGKLGRNSTLCGNHDSYPIATKRVIRFYQRKASN